MGKEWYRSARSSKRGSGCDGDAENPSGCMCAFFQFFDLHPLHFPIQQQQPPPSFKPPSSITEDQNSIPKGAEAPRNSLESEDGTMSSISKEDLRIPKSIQIKTSRRERGENGNNDLSSEISSSPSTKTPTLVARLMGLDLLPDAQSPSSSSSSSSLSCLSTPNPRGNSRFYQLKPRQQQHILTKPRNSTDSDIVVSRSLPETPRISSARRSDVEHRLSLQINKENIGVGEDLELPRFSFSKRKFEENSCRSPSHYARQIVKQVKESVSRKVGLDITNTVKNREQAREEHVGQFRVKKSPKTSLKAIDESSPGKHSNSNTSCSSSSSPRLRFMEAKQHKPNTATTTTPSPLTPKDQNSLSVNLPSSPPINIIQPQIIARVLAKPKPQELQNQRSASKCKKDANEKFSPRLKKPLQTSSAVMRNKQEESFVRPPSPTRANEFKSRSKRTNNLLNISTVLPNVLPVKTDPSPPATKIPPQKQIQVSDAQESKRSSQLSSCSRQTCRKQEAKCTLANRESNSEEDDKIHGASTTGPNGPPLLSTEYDVINMMARTTESTTTTEETVVVSLNNNHKWLYSIFHHLNRETYLDNQPDLRRNRRLLFDLIGEILVGEILKPWVVVQRDLGFESIVETVWKRIGSFKGAKCEVLEDIDGVIEKEDLGKTKKEGLDWKEGLVEEIEGYILETMMQEAVIACGVV